jgi:hypothetical protein
MLLFEGLCQWVHVKFSMRRDYVVLDILVSVCLFLIFSLSSSRSEHPIIRLLPMTHDE